MPTPAEIMAARDKAYAASVAAHQQQMARPIGGAGTGGIGSAPQISSKPAGRRSNVDYHPLGTVGAGLNAVADVMKAKFERDARVSKAEQIQDLISQPPSAEIARKLRALGENEIADQIIGQLNRAENRTNVLSDREAEQAREDALRAEDRQNAVSDRLQDRGWSKEDADAEAKRLEAQRLQDRTWSVEDREDKQAHDITMEDRALQREEQAAADAAAEEQSEAAAEAEELQGSYAQFVELLNDENFPGAVGMVDQYTGQIGAQFGSKEGILGERAERLSGRMILDAAASLKGQMSDKDIELLESTAPTRGDDHRVYADWFRSQFLPTVNAARKRAGMDPLKDQTFSWEKDSTELSPEEQAELEALRQEYR